MEKSVTDDVVLIFTVWFFDGIASIHFLTNNLVFTSTNLNQSMSSFSWGDIQRNTLWPSSQLAKLYTLHYRIYTKHWMVNCHYLAPTSTSIHLRRLFFQGTHRGGSLLCHVSLQLFTSQDGDHLHTAQPKRVLMLARNLWKQQGKRGCLTLVTQTDKNMLWTTSLFKLSLHVGSKNRKGTDF